MQQEVFIMVIETVMSEIVILLTGLISGTITALIYGLIVLPLFPDLLDNEIFFTSVGLVIFVIITLIVFTTITRIFRK